jgi:hypothetical protein
MICTLRGDAVFIKRPVEYHPACWVDENRLAEGD